VRLDVFLPFVRKTKPGTSRKPPGLVVRAAARLVPRRWLTDPAAGKPGPVRKLLKRIGPTWSSSPFRRVVQAVCFIAFLVLFLYVAFPYTARPARAWNGWVPVEVDGDNGRVTLDADAATERPRVGELVVAVDSAPADASETSPPFGRFRVAAAADRG
jgi:hypothetical protein